MHCGQMVGWIKMKLGMRVGLGPAHIVLGGDPAPPPLKGHSPHPIFGPYLLRPNGCMDQDVTWYGARPRPSDFVLDWDPVAPPQRGGGGPPKFSAHVYCAQTSGWMKLALGVVVGLSPGEFVLDET